MTERDGRLFGRVVHTAIQVTDKVSVPSRMDGLLGGLGTQVGLSSKVRTAQFCSV